MTSDAADIIDAKIAPLLAENERLKEVIRVNDLCHDKDQRVGAREYADGCSAQQRKLFGCAPDADENAALRQRVTELEQDAKRYRWIQVYAARSHSPHMDNTWCFELRRMLNGRHSTFDAAIDAAMEDA